METIGAIYELIRLAFITRFRLRGPWWQWRLHTAFGSDLPPSRLELVRSVFDFGCWVYRMRGQS